jgi:hypothetical protein
MTKGTVFSLLLIMACVAGIGALQTPIAERVAAVKLREDVFALPPPNAIGPMSLGYGQAGADLVWIKLLVEYGTHFSKRMYFRDAALFADDIIALDPKHRPLYSFIDTILIYQPTDSNQSRGDADDCRAARRILQRGLVEFPYDAELWLHYGQFIAFMGPAYLSDEAEITQWRVDGAKAIGRAMELGIPVSKTMAAAAVLGSAGESHAQIAFLERAFAMSDDPDERERLRARLNALHDSAVAEQGARILKSVDSTWRKSMPFTPRSTYLLMSPIPDRFACAGRDKSTTLDCMSSWSDVDQSLAPKMP